MSDDNVPLILAQFMKAWRSDDSDEQQETPPEDGYMGSHGPSDSPLNDSSKVSRKGIANKEV